MNERRVSPCLSCTRVANPRQCDDKDCQLWRRWFAGRWDALRRDVRKGMENAHMAPVGVEIGGQHYASPNQVENYLNHDPCNGCGCPKDLCDTPCRVKRGWLEARQDVLL